MVYLHEIHKNDTGENDLVSDVLASGDHIFDNAPPNHNHDIGVYSSHLFYSEKVKPFSLRAMCVASLKREPLKSEVVRGVSY